MEEIELYNELQNVEGCLKIVDSQIYLDKVLKELED